MNQNSNGENLKPQRHFILGLFIGLLIWLGDVAIQEHDIVHLKQDGIGFLIGAGIYSFIHFVILRGK